MKKFGKLFCLAAIFIFALAPVLFFGCNNNPPENPDSQPEKPGDVVEEKDYYAIDNIYIFFPSGSSVTVDKVELNFLKVYVGDNLIGGFNLNTDQFNLGSSTPKTLYSNDNIADYNTPFIINLDKNNYNKFEESTNIKLNIDSYLHCAKDSESGHVGTLAFKEFTVPIGSVSFFDVFYLDAQHGYSIRIQFNYVKL